MQDHLTREYGFYQACTSFVDCLWLHCHWIIVAYTSVWNTIMYQSVIFRIWPIYPCLCSIFPFRSWICYFVDDIFVLMCHKCSYPIYLQSICCKLLLSIFYKVWGGQLQKTFRTKMGIPFKQVVDAEICKSFSSLPKLVFSIQVLPRLDPIFSSWYRPGNRFWWAYHWISPSM